jgi:hypothetical protein
MRHLSRGVIIGAGITAVTLICLLVVSTTVNSQPPEPKDAVAEPAPPTGQTYTGAKRCSSCHFKQYMTWKKTKHAKEAWESMAAKYRTSAECLPCHATGYGEPTGFKDEASTPNLVGTTCEACHGPGSKHEEACKPYLNKKKLSPEEDKIARDSIYKILPRNVCASCHLAQGHKEHPKYDKE